MGQPLPLDIVRGLRESIRKRKTSLSEGSRQRQEEEVVSSPMFGRTEPYEWVPGEVKDEKDLEYESIRKSVNERLGYGRTGKETKVTKSKEEPGTYFVDQPIVGVDYLRRNKRGDAVEKVGAYTSFENGKTKIYTDSYVEEQERQIADLIVIPLSVGAAGFLGAFTGGAGAAALAAGGRASLGQLVKSAATKGAVMGATAGLYEYGYKQYAKEKHGADVSGRFKTELLFGLAGAFTWEMITEEGTLFALKSFQKMAKGGKFVSSSELLEESLAVKKFFEASGIKEFQQPIEDGTSAAALVVKQLASQADAGVSNVDEANKIVNATLNPKGTREASKKIGKKLEEAADSIKAQQLEMFDPNNLKMGLLAPVAYPPALVTEVTLRIMAKQLLGGGEQTFDLVTREMMNNPDWVKRFLTSEAGVEALNQREWQQLYEQQALRASAILMGRTDSIWLNEINKLPEVSSEFERALQPFIKRAQQEDRIARYDALSGSVTTDDGEHWDDLLDHIMSSEKVGGGVQRQRTAIDDVFESGGDIHELDVLEDPATLSAFKKIKKEKGIKNGSTAELALLENLEQIHRGEIGLEDNLDDPRFMSLYNLVRDQKSVKPSKYMSAIDQKRKIQYGRGDDPTGRSILSKATAGKEGKNRLVREIRVAGQRLVGTGKFKEQIDTMMELENSTKRQLERLSVIHGVDFTDVDVRRMLMEGGEPNLVRRLYDISPTTMTEANIADVYDTMLLNARASQFLDEHMEDIVSVGKVKLVPNYNMSPIGGYNIYETSSAIRSVERAAEATGFRNPEVVFQQRVSKNGKPYIIRAWEDELDDLRTVARPLPELSPDDVTRLLVAKKKIDKKLVDISNLWDEVGGFSMRGFMNQLRFALEPKAIKSKGLVKKTIGWTNKSNLTADQVAYLQELLRKRDAIDTMLGFVPRSTYIGSRLGKELKNGVSAMKLVKRVAAEHRPRVIISGGQTGADIAGLKAARQAGLETGGVAPVDFLTEVRKERELLEGFGLTESEFPKRYPTHWVKGEIAGADVPLALKNLAGEDVRTFTRTGTHWDIEVMSTGKRYSVPKEFIASKGKNAEGAKRSWKARMLAARTRTNVLNADATIIFAHPRVNSPGSRLTRNIAHRSGKPYLVVDPSDTVGAADSIQQFFNKYKPDVVNIAGHRKSQGERVIKNFEARVERILSEALTDTRFSDVTGQLHRPMPSGDALIYGKAMARKTSANSQAVSEIRKAYGGKEIAQEAQQKMDALRDAMDRITNGRPFEELDSVEKSRVDYLKKLIERIACGA